MYGRRDRALGVAVKTGATKQQIEDAARSHFNHANKRRVLPPWDDGTPTSYHQSWVENMGYYAPHLVRETHRIIALDDLKHLVAMTEDLDWDGPEEALLNRMRALIAGDDK